MEAFPVMTVEDRVRDLPLVSSCFGDEDSDDVAQLTRVSTVVDMDYYRLYMCADIVAFTAWSSGWGLKLAKNEKKPS